MYKKHSIEERLLAVPKCLEGYAPRGVGRMLGIKEHYVSEWLERYRQNGIAGLQKRPNILKKNAKLFANMQKNMYLGTEFAQSIMFLKQLYPAGHVSTRKQDMRICAL